MQNKLIRILTITYVIVCALGLTACTEKTKALRDLEKLAKEVRKHGEDYDIFTWKDVYVQYRSINIIIDSHYAEYSQRNRNRILKARSDIKNTAIDTLMDKVESIPFVKELFFMFITSKVDETVAPIAMCG